MMKGSACQSGLMQALMRPSHPMIQPSLGGLKQFLPFPMSSASAAASLFPGFSTQSPTRSTVCSVVLMGRDPRIEHHRLHSPWTGSEHGIERSPGEPGSPLTQPVLLSQSALRNAREID
ncbi:unnamed protein product [Arctogadus glacialis]